MPKFLCRHCGIITDDPEIVPHRESDEFYRSWFDTLPRGCYNHSITCPVCLGITYFWRESRFPVDDPTSALSIGQMLKDMNL